jgi:outer membrane protein assembly factor BamB
MKRGAAFGLALVLAGVGYARAEDVDRGMFGNTPTRNMVSGETGLPDDWNPKTGLNIKWSQPTGSQTYAGPVLANGRVYVGTNNEGHRNPDVVDDHGVVMAFSADTGDFLWQMLTAKLPAGRVNDWPLQGVCSTPYVEGDRLYYVSNQAHVTCLDAEGFADGENDGPYTEETLTDEHAGDVIWTYDMIGELDAFPHNLAVSSPLVVGDLVYVSTGNGTDEGHVNIPSPLAPSFVAVNKNTGELVWENAMPGNNILHGTWTNASYAEIDGVKQILFPGGDGWLYSLEPETGELIWKFDCNPKDAEWVLGGRGTRNNLISSPVVYDDKVYIGVGQDPEHGEAPGHFWVIDATGKGDVTDTHLVWTRGGEDFHRTISSAAIKDDVVYIADLSGFLYALDAQTGEHFWTYDAFAAIWGSAFVADGKVYLGDEDGDVVILKEGKELEEINEINMGASVYTTPIAHDGVLYLASRNHLYAIQDGIPAK